MTFNIDEAIDDLLEKGIIVCVGYNEHGDELYMLAEQARAEGRTIYPSIEQNTEMEEQ